MQLQRVILVLAHKNTKYRIFRNSLYLMHHRWCDIKNDEFHRVIFTNDALQRVILVRGHKNTKISHYLKMHNIDVTSMARYKNDVITPRHIKKRCNYSASYQYTVTKITKYRIFRKCC
jgi:hypothetical protein